MLTLSDIAYTYPESPEPLFEHVSATFPAGWTAVLGDNGIGKTTLINIALGKLKADRGNIGPAPGTLVSAYCAQETTAKSDTIDDFASDWSPYAMAVRNALRIDDTWLYRYESLSGGEAKRVQLACAMAMQPDLLVLDEPTNHVDARTCDAIIAAMRQYHGIGIVISHDVTLIDETCRRCVVFERRHVGTRNITVVNTYSGGYTQSAAQIEAAAARDNKMLATAKSEVGRLQAVQAQRFQNVQHANSSMTSGSHINAKDHDAIGRRHLAKATSVDGAASRAYAQMDARVAAAKSKAAGITVAAKRYDGTIWLDARLSRRRELVRIGPGILIFGGDGVISQESADCLQSASSSLQIDGMMWQVKAMGADTQAGLDTATAGIKIPALSVGPTDHIGMMGPNGSGKTTVIRALEAAMPDDVPTLTIGQCLDDATVSAALDRLAALSSEARAAVLSAYARLNADPDRLLAGGAPSPGESRKLLLALGVVDNPQLIIMDEPTNHLDLSSKQALAACLADFPGALVLVSHDEWFLRQVMRR